MIELVFNCYIRQFIQINLLSQIQRFKCWSIDKKHIPKKKNVFIAWKRGFLSPYNSGSLYFWKIKSYAINWCHNMLACDGTIRTSFIICQNLQKKRNLKHGTIIRSHYSSMLTPPPPYGVSKNTPSKERVKPCFLWLLTLS